MTLFVAVGMTMMTQNRSADVLTSQQEAHLSLSLKQDQKIKTGSQTLPFSAEVDTNATKKETMAKTDRPEQKTNEVKGQASGGCDQNTASPGDGRPTSDNSHGHESREEAIVGGTSPQDSLKRETRQNSLDDKASPERDSETHVLSAADKLGQAKTANLVDGEMEESKVKAKTLPARASSLGNLAADKDPSSTLPGNIISNNRALKRIRKLSEWFVKHRCFRAENMRDRLCAHVNDIYRSSNVKDDRASGAQKLPVKGQQQKSSAPPNRRLSQQINGQISGSTAPSGQPTKTANKRTTARKQANGGTRDKSMVVADQEQSSSMGLGGGLANGRGTHEGSKDVAMNNEDQSMSLVESSLHTSNKKGNGARRPPKDSDATQKRDTGLENSKIPAGETVKAKPVIQSCYNKFGCPYNAKHAKQLTLREEQSVTEKKPKFTTVKLPYGRNESVNFCCYCYECFKQNDKCDYCYQVYFSDAQDQDVDGGLWMSCDKCNKWNHPDCEVQHGQDAVYKAIAKKEMMASDGENSPAIGSDLNEDMAVDETAQKSTTKGKDLGSNSPSPLEESQDGPSYYCLRCRKELDQSAKNAKGGKPTTKGNGKIGQPSKRGATQSAKKPPAPSKSLTKTQLPQAKAPPAKTKKEKAVAPVRSSRKNSILTNSDEKVSPEKQDTTPKLGKKKVSIAAPSEEQEAADGNDELSTLKETPLLETKGPTMQLTQQNSGVQPPTTAKAAPADEETKEDQGKAGKTKTTKQPVANGSPAKTQQQKESPKLGEEQPPTQTSREKREGQARGESVPSTATPATTTTKKGVTTAV